MKKIIVLFLLMVSGKVFSQDFQKPGYITVNLQQVGLSIKLRIVADCGIPGQDKKIHELFSGFPETVKSFTELLNAMDNIEYDFVNAYPGVIGTGPYVSSNYGQMPLYIFKKR